MRASYFHTLSSTYCLDAMGGHENIFTKLLVQNLLNQVQNLHAKVSNKILFARPW
jgi:hypothetical protein